MKIGSSRCCGARRAATVLVLSIVATSTLALAPDGDSLATTNGPDDSMNINKYSNADAPDESLLEQMAGAADNGEIEDEEEKVRRGEAEYYEYTTARGSGYEPWTERILEPKRLWYIQLARPASAGIPRAGP